MVTTTTALTRLWQARKDKRAGSDQDACRLQKEIKLTDKKAAARHERYRQSQRLRGFKPRTLWLSDTEVAKVKVYVDKLRDPDKVAGE